MKYSVYYVRKERYVNVQNRILNRIYEPTADDYQHVTDVEADNIEDVFIKMQVIDGDEPPAKLHIRSMAVGDAAATDESVHVCMTSGWKQITDPFFLPGLLEIKR